MVFVRDFIPNFQQNLNRRHMIFLLKNITNIEETASHVDNPELSSDPKPDWERKFAPYGSHKHPFFLPLQPFLDQIKFYHSTSQQITAMFVPKIFTTAFRSCHPDWV